ncbi:NADH-quinone oxidoreductase subunit NuoN [Enterovirga sp.]|jgi:NADH-quinone oxidoreductase subunit N|uniref:NADH-quinone oxidoreductase subunit NuoN n=1 Tax=Enterovirga sp. TaxID=2026350 RepID=UPI002625AB31|nr:NADH-quinone oxidoreductase subunit NuoN [Enterovirga sp.]MDB5590934.1 NADH-quinone oxidoreductase subunit NuoN [Enterovirga sp.]
MSTTFMATGFWPALPEIILALGALALTLVGAYRGERSTVIVGTGAFVVILLALVAVGITPRTRVTTFGGSYISDDFARYMKALVLLAAAATIALSSDFMERQRFARFEYPLLILLSTTGSMMMISANDLIALYLGLELQSLAAYVICAIHRDNVRSSEAGLKYFVLGALSSGMLLYGASLVYGFTGTVSLPAIAASVQGQAPIGLTLGLVFLAAGIAFKLAAAPFHMWTPDVYEGAPTPVTAFLASAQKVAAIALAVRVFIGGFPSVAESWQQIIVFVAILSMLIGSFAAIGQTNIKRLMAYSSIGNIGYALIGLAAGTPEGIQGIIVYMAIYLAMTLGAFAVILGMRRGDTYVEGIDDLSGAAQTHPWRAFALAMMLFSLAGIPPLAGFFAKFYVFAAAIQANLFVLAVIGVVTSVVGAYYYIRIVKIMYFDAPRPAFERLPDGPQAVLIACSVVVVLFWMIPAPLVSSAESAARSLFN